MSIDNLSAAKAYGTALKALSNNPAGAAEKTAQIAGGQKADFGNILTESLNQLEASGQKMDKAGLLVAEGKGDLVELVTTMAETELTVETLVNVRDKIISAYKDIMNMPI